MLNIIKNEPANRTITGDFFVKYFNPINNSDFFELNDAQFRNINYSISDDGPDPINPGVDSISFTAGDAD